MVLPRFIGADSSNALDLVPLQAEDSIPVDVSS